MCGIYGFIGQPLEQNKTSIMKLFTVMGILTEPRGIHATGYYGINDHILTEKAPLKASNFFQTEQYLKLFNQPVMNVLIGHNRWATHGDPKENENNHPFTTSRFGFIHNGIVSGVDVDIKQKTDCDSEKIFRYFLKHIYNDHNHFTSIEKTMLAFKDGDFACAMVDSKDRSLLLFRNEGRPICYYFMKKYNMWVFSSTEKIMSDAFKECNETIDIKNIQYVSCGQIVKITEDLKIESKIVEGMKPKVYKKYFSNSIVRIPTIKKNKLVGWQCKRCGRIYLTPVFVKDHIIKIHEITDLEEITKMIQHTTDKKAKVAFAGLQRIHIV